MAEKLVLYNIETDRIIEFDLPEEEVRRARNDIHYATELLNNSMNMPEAPSNCDEDADNVSCQDISTNTAQASYDNTISTNEVIDDENGVYRWTTPCVLLLLDTYSQLEHKFTDGKHSQKKVWEEVSSKIKESGYKLTGPQCASKLRSLKKTYKAIKDHNNKSGNDRRSWKFFQHMNDLFAKKAWAEPVALASSSGATFKSGGNSSPAASTASGVCENKGNVKNLLIKRLRQKEEHEEGKAKRHRERMEMDNKFLEVLEKLVNK